MGFKCKVCGTEFTDKTRLQRHMGVHGKKPKIVGAGSMDFDKVGF